MSLEIDDFELTPETQHIRGFWIDLGSKVEKDSGWMRIEWLLKHRLEPVAQRDQTADALYRNPADATYWHCYLVSPHMRDDSPPVLERIDIDRARELFGQFN